MMSKRLTKFALAAWCMLFVAFSVSAQSFNGSTTNTAGNSAIPSAGNGGCGVAPQTAAGNGTRFDCAVAGVTAGNALAQVRVNFTHTWDSDLRIYLVNPAGAILELSTGNGGSGDNFTNTIFCDGAANNITAGAPPYTGSFRPEGTLAAQTCGITVTPTVATVAGMGSAAGTWQLLFLDGAGGDSGTMLSWALEFAAPCTFDAANPLPALNLVGTDPLICGAQGSLVTAPTVTCTSGSALLNVSLDGVAQGTVAPGATLPFNIPPGPHTLTYSLPNCTFRTQALTVSGDQVPPTLTVPANITINLGPGACAANYSYNVSCTDNCGFSAPSGTVNHPIDFNNGQAGVMFDVTNLSTNPIRITGFSPSLDPGSFTVETYYTTSASTWVGNATTPGNWTLLASGTVSPVSTNPGTAVPVGAGLTLAPGESKGIYITSTTGFPMNYTNASRSFEDVALRVNANPGGGVPYPFGAPFQSRAYNGGVTYETVAACTPGTQQTSGLGSGEEFPIGTTVNTFTCTDAACNATTKSFSVTVLEYPTPITSLVCNDLVYVSVDENCSAVIGADQVLEGGPYGCYDDYIVELDKTAPFGNGPWVPAVVGPSDIGKTYQVRVTDPATNNKCWGNLKVEDKLAPTLDCPDVVLPCNFNLDPTYSQTAELTLRFGTTSALPQPYTDFQTFDFDIPVGISGTITDVDFRTKCSGDAFFFNTNMSILSPAGTTVIPWSLVGGCNPDPIWARFDDEGSNALTCANFTTDQRAQIPFGFGVLSDFDGEDPQGNWVVSIGDADAFGDQNLVEIVELYITIQATFSAGFPNQLAYPSEVSGNNPFVVQAGAGTPVLEPCSNATLSYIDATSATTCNGNWQTVTRKWTAVDASGNSSTCAQEIGLLTPGVADLTLPPSYDNIAAPALACNGAYPTPCVLEGLGLQGMPYVFGIPGDCTEEAECNLGWEYDDVVINVCDGTYKIAREWTIIDWCTGQRTVYNQIIKVLDEAGPEITCPANMTVSTDPYQCCATVDLPDVIVSDVCSQVNDISAMVVTFDPFTGEQTGMYTVNGNIGDFAGNNWWVADTMGYVGNTPCLPLGTHTVTYMVEDDCGNTSTCSFRLTVRDLVPPDMVCTEFTTVTVGYDDVNDCYGPAGYNNVPPALDACNSAGVRWVTAKAFDQGTTDNCSNLKFTVQRMEPYSDCIANLNQINGFGGSCNDPFKDFPTEYERATGNYDLDAFEGGDSIKFYCCEVGLPAQQIIVRAYQVDLNGDPIRDALGQPIFDACMVWVEVEDKIKPTCTPPAPVTTTCELFDESLWAYGKATPKDNCCLDTSIVFQGQCGLSVTVNRNNFDTVCNKGTITRTFRATDCHGNTSTCTQRIIVTYEQDYFVKFPNDRIVTVCDGSGNYGAPEFFGEDCELLGVSYQDVIFTVVPDACFKIERTWQVINWCTYNPNAPCVYVPNPNPSNTTNAPANLTGPTVSACGTPQPWNPTVIKINPTDPTATDYCSFYNANANCYQYKQIIKVIDTQDPTGTWVQPSCETQNWYTANDPQFWNDTPWWDATHASHDLCEEPTDLSIQATDACSGANVNVEYSLFLDLDGDGVMETIINSTNLPGFNRVYFGNNDGDADVTDGDPRAFDFRPVPGNQKWGFSIREDVSGTTKTASVRWWNQQQASVAGAKPAEIPQLPHGTHKIKWFISDGCGNDKVEEYTFTVKDCKAPTVVCLNGLSVNIMPTQMIQLWASDFLQYTEDNCTPNPLKLGIRKSGTGTGFPVDANGNPITQVTFTCDELGTQFVELWAIDAAGNADYCETYVIVQDNNGNCNPQDKVNVAGALKTEMNDGLEQAGVTLTGSHPALPPAGMFSTTDAQGAYNFNAVPVAPNYTLTPNEDDQPLNGVSTYDLVLISKHILGIETLNSPYKMIAADANKSGSITTFDIVELRKLLLGIYQELPNNTSWRFVDKSYSFPNAQNPFQAQFPENAAIANLATNMMDEDFVSVKVGDVNASAQANSLMQADDRTAGTLLFDVADQQLKAGEETVVTFKASDVVAGYQFTMGLNGLKAVSVQPISGDMSADNFAIFADAVTTSFNGKNAGEFAVTFRAEKAGKLSEMLQVSSRITKAEAYNEAGRLNVAFRYDGKVIAGQGFELYQNVPNPFVAKTQIGFYLPEATTATLRVFDASGRVVWEQSGAYAKGQNSIWVDRAAVGNSGILYYTLETETNSATKKMIQTK